MAKIRRFGLLRNNFVPDSRPCVNTFHVVITRPLYLLNVFDDLCCNFSVGVFVDLFFIYVGESGFFLYFGNFVAIFLGSVVNFRLSTYTYTVLRLPICNCSWALLVIHAITLEEGFS